MNPILKDFPDHFETERLTARCPRPGDGVTVAEAINQSRAELKPWLDWVPDEYSVEEAELYVRKTVAEFILREKLRFYLFLKSDGAFVGNILLFKIEWSVPVLELGYWQDTSHSGQGYMTEAVIGLTEFAHQWLDARRIEIRCDTRHVKSRKVAERAGYTVEATSPNAYRDRDNRLCDDFILVKTWPDEITKAE